MNSILSLNIKVNSFKNSCKKRFTGFGLEDPQKTPTTKGFKSISFRSPKMGHNWQLELLNKEIPSTLKLISNVVLFCNAEFSDNMSRNVFTKPIWEYSPLSFSLQLLTHEFLVMFCNLKVGRYDMGEDVINLLLKCVEHCI